MALVDAYNRMSDLQQMVLRLQTPDAPPQQTAQEAPSAFQSQLAAALPTAPADEAPAIPLPVATPADEAPAIPLPVATPAAPATPVDHGAGCCCCTCGGA